MYNGTEFNNNDMNQFYGMKWIKREFNVSRTPQKNRVAERKNKTLIEAVRTTLADSLLPTTFWAKAVNTACYVQNRVLVTKPHNKTPYELLHGSGPYWLFDIDLLTNSMNYEPVTTGNQTNRNTGIKDNVDAVPTQQYILLPFLPGRPQSLEDAVVDDVGKNITEEPAKEGERNSQEKEEEASNKEGDQHVQDLRAELDKLLVQQKEGYANSTNRVSTVSPSVSAAGQSFVNDLPTDPLIPDLEDTTNLLNTGIFSGAYDDEDVGAEADLNNLETTMNVSPIPTTRIHKDHPKDQIIRDINLATQTRRMTKISEEHAMRLVDLPKDKHAIGTKWVYRNKKDERGIVVRNKARLVVQGYTQEEGIDYNEMDMKSAFLYGTIEEEVHVCQPPGIEDPQFPNKVYKVEKALYGLHQAPRAWYETLSTYLLENRFRRGTIDKTLFIKKDKDDAQEIPDEFYGGAQFLLRVTVNTASTPIETNKALLKDEEAEDVDVHLYKSMIGSLMCSLASINDLLEACRKLPALSADLKTKKFEEIQALYEKIKRSDEDFISIRSAKDERLIKRLNEKGFDSSKNEMVNEEDKEEEGSKKRKGGHIKMIARKKARKQSDIDSLVVLEDIYTTRIVMKNPNHLNANTEAIPEMNQVVPEPNQVVDIHDPNEMVDIPDCISDKDVDLSVIMNVDDEENRKNVSGRKIYWFGYEENDMLIMRIMKETKLFEILSSIYAELIFPYEVEGNKTLPHGGMSSNSKPPNVESSDFVSSDSESEEKEADASRARSRVTEAELGTCQTEIALLKSKNKIKEKEREMPNHDLGNVEHVLGDVLERLKVLESRENATSKNKLVKAEMKLELARMEHDMVIRDHMPSYSGTKVLYGDVRIGAVPKPPSERRKRNRSGERKSKRNFLFDGPRTFRAIMLTT
ncbi:putative ribonuclease H-like domain-containing protein [Tanacetum coccineum]